MWWWVLAQKEVGKRFILGPFEGEVSARNKAESLSYPYKLFELPTRSEGRATRMIKAELLKVDRMGHGVS